MTDDVSIIVSQDDADIAKAWSVRREVFADEQGIPAHLDPDGRDSDAFHVLCLTGNSVIGTGRLFSTDSNNGVLSRIAIRQPFRGHGLGRRIVRELEAVAVAQGLTALTLQPHQHLETFYRSLGYHTISGSEVVAGHELITMEKAIG